jgi:Phage tail tube protein, TTP
MAQVPTGTTFYIASTFGTPITTTIVTNAAEAVVTAAGHGLANGDVVEVTSGWGRLNLRVFEVKSVTTDTFVLKGADTSITNFFPAGLGVGSVREITAFTQITQVLNPTSQGGEPRQVDFRYVESDVDFSINNGFSATSYTLQLDADSIGTAGYTALKSLTDVQTDTCLKMLSRNGARIFQPCTVALNEAVSLQQDQVNSVTASFNGKNRLTRYSQSE